MEDNSGLLLFKAHLRFNGQPNEALASIVTWHMVLDAVCFISYQNKSAWQSQILVKCYRNKAIQDH